jgi:aminopeptidase N
VPGFVKMLVGGMGKEPTVSVLQTLHLTAARLMATTADPKWLPEGKEQLASAAIPLLQAAEPGSDHQLAWAQLLAWTAITPDQLDLLGGLLDGTQQIDGLVVDTELRWALVRRLAATGRADDGSIDAELARDATDAGRRHAVACRAAIPDAEHKAAAWRLVAGSEELGHEGVMAVGAAFANPEHAELLTPYPEAYFQVLPEIWASRGDHLKRVIADSLFPQFAASPELIRRIDAFLAEDDRDPALVRLLVEHKDVVRRALASRELPA